MRLVIGTLALLAASCALAQNRDAYPRIESALALSMAQANVVLDVGGWQQTGRTRQNLQLRVYAKDGNALAQQFINDVREIDVIADGKKVWRYDTVANEYTFLDHPENLVKTMSLIAAWSRSQFQRPLRMMAGGVRWLVAPTFEEGDDFVRVYQTRPTPGGDWRGTDIKFTFDDNGRVDRFTIEDRLDTLAGFKHVWLEGLFAYPATLDVSFKFSPPPGSKPAADLPVRISGDGG